MNKEIRWVAIAFFLVAIAFRFLPHWPNMAPIAALALFAGCHISGRSGMILAFGAMAFSDLLGAWFEVPGMGFYNRTTMLTVYVALALIALVGIGLRGRVNALTVPLASVAGTAIFFLATNFACWIDPLMGYSQNAQGLMSCYVNALPFALSTLVGDLLYSGLLFGSYALVIAPNFSAKTANSAGN